MGVQLAGCWGGRFKKSWLQSREHSWVALGAWLDGVTEQAELS